jgi:hypothetical protein
MPLNYLFGCNHIRLHDIFSQNKTPLVFSEGVILNLTGYCGVFFARGFAGFFSAGALIAAGFGAAALRGFFAGRAGSATIFPTMSGLLGWLAHCSGDSLCRPTQYPVALRPQPHLGGSLAGTYGSDVVAAGGSN